MNTVKRSYWTASTGAVVALIAAAGFGFDGGTSITSAQGPESTPAVFANVPGNIWPPAKGPVPGSPALSPDEAIETFSLPPGYRVELVAAEPLVESPILIDFDADGRLWVVEMPAFLPDLTGRDSTEPMNRVVVLEDTNADGKMDKRTIFADRLVMPRAIKVLETGVLIGEPPHLWLMKDTDGDLKADTKEVVVNTYGTGNNVEHDANSLFWAMDNTMYSSEHVWNLRYKGNGQFESLPTLSRGQWQISQDDAGRIFRNTNGSPLFVDYTPARYFLRNPNNPRTGGLYERLITQAESTIYPVRPTRGVNRGYRDENFRADGSSIIIQGAGTPTIYRGDRYPEDLRGDAFITDSPTNLVHRIAVRDAGGGRLTATNGYERGEFLASSDERFRPVSLASAPDGTMYVVDMYRGVIQAGGYWTDFLSEYIKNNNLSLPVGRGRIWRVVHGTGSSTRGPQPQLSNATHAQLVETLAHPNGWWRDMAQQLLVERGDRSVANALKAAALNAADWRTRLHALWTLDGLNAIEPSTIETALRDTAYEVRSGAVRISERWLQEPGHAIAGPVLNLFSDPSWEVRRQVGASLGELPVAARVDPAVQVLALAGGDAIIVDATVSGLRGVEEEVLQRLLQTTRQSATSAPVSEAVMVLSAALARRGDAATVQSVIDLAADSARPSWQRMALLSGLDMGVVAGGGGRGGRGGGGQAGGAARVPVLATEPTALIELGRGTGEFATVARSVSAKLSWVGKPAPPPPPAVAPLTAAEERRFEAGKVVFDGLCVGCHNEDGRGKPALGPSLVGSKYVQAAAAFPIRIVTSGKEGPIGLMPPLIGPGGLTDEQIAAVLTYIRRSWGHTASPVTENEVRETRQSSMRRTPWTEAELSALLASSASGGRGRGGAGGQ